MDNKSPVRMLFLDIGGVLLSNGWDREMRKRAARKFGLDFEEMQDRHEQVCDIYECGALTLTEYLQQVVFGVPRAFSVDDFEGYMFVQSSPHPDVIDLFINLKKEYGLRVAAISNEGRELTVHRVKAFALNRLIDFYVSSCFVHLRKPDTRIFRLALDLAQVDVASTLYVDDRPMHVESAKNLDIPGFIHRSCAETRDELAARGLPLDEFAHQNA